MSGSFDREFWETHWRESGGRQNAAEPTVNPHLVREIGHLPPGAALDAGCGEGAEAIWLARAGWQVTAVDISAEAIARASLQSERHPASASVQWVAANLEDWEPERRFDLVATHYAHPSISQLSFYERISQWVAPGGTLLIVGHLHTDDGHGHHHHPHEASVSAASVVAVLDPATWIVVTADETTRTVADRGGHQVQLADVVVRATRSG